MEDFKDGVYTLHGARRWGQLPTLDRLGLHSGQKLEGQEY